MCVLCHYNNCLISKPYPVCHCDAMILQLCALPSGPIIYPTQQGSELRNDIIILVKFWQMMHADKKYITTNVVPFSG